MCKLETFRTDLGEGITVSVGGRPDKFGLWRACFYGFVVLAAMAWPGGQARAFETSAPIALLFDVNTRTLLYAKDHEVPFFPAALSKLATMSIVQDEIDSGRLDPETLYTISENAWRTGGAPSGRATMFAEINSDVSVANLMRGTAVMSANDGAIALAEGVAGSEEAFVPRMNALAERLDMTATRFESPSGDQAAGGASTAHDIQRLALHIVTECSLVLAG